MAFVSDDISSNQDTNKFFGVDGGLNLISLIQLSETLLVELIGSHHL